MRTLLLTALLLLPTPVHQPQRGRDSFDVQAHRGGLGLRVENTLASFGNALQLGVSTLELDVQITADGAAVVTHDRRVTAAKCTGDFAGRFIKDLTLAQVRSMDCGSLQQSGFPGQLPVPVRRYLCFPRFFPWYARIGKQVTIQSFDWGALMRMRQVEPSLPLVALTNSDFLQTGQPGASPWLGARFPAEREGHRPELPALCHR